jgi:hypothetical protein
VNTSNNQITITGNNFSQSGLAPTVVFAHTHLGLASFTNQQAVAHLPSGFGAGTYFLTVTNSSSQTAYTVGGLVLAAVLLVAVLLRSIACSARLRSILTIV